MVFDEDAAVPYLYQGKLWVSYDNEKSVYEKVRCTGTGPEVKKLFSCSTQLSMKFSLLENI